MKNVNGFDDSFGIKKRELGNSHQQADTSGFPSGSPLAGLICGERTDGRGKLRLVE